MDFDLAIVNGRVITPLGVTETDLWITQGRIHSLVEPGSPVAATQTIDAAGLFVMPGAIDIHFHCRAPSFPERGDFSTETRAAGAGGVTSVFEMPVSKPPASTPAAWDERRKQLERDAYVNVGLYAGPGRLEQAEIQAMADAGAIGFKIFLSRAPAGREDEFDGLIATDAATIYRVLEMVARTGRRTVFHAEEDSLLEMFLERARASKRSDYRLHPDSRPPVVEATAIAMLTTLARDLNALVHVAHLTSREGVELIRAARAAGTTSLTAETCPHYLLFTSEVLERVGAFGKINPPIRELRDQEALWQGLQDGTIDVIATDHSPFTVTEKQVPPENILSAPPGHPGVEILVPFVMTQALCGRLTLNQAVDLISTRPAKMFNLYPRKGLLAPGSDADITLYDPAGEHVVRHAEWLTKVADANRLYDGWTSQGRVHATVLNGKIIYCKGKFLGQPGDGKLVRPL